MGRRKFNNSTTHDEALDAVVFTREALAIEVDESDRKLAAPLAALVKELDPLVAQGDALAVERRARRREVTRAHARVRRRDVRADRATQALHDDLLGAVKQNRAAPLFQRFFGEPVSLILKRALGSQLPYLKGLARVLKEKETPAALRKSHAAAIDDAATLGQKALDLREDAFSEQGRTRARMVSWRDDANRALLGVEGVLQRLAAQHGLDEDWVDGFFPASPAGSALAPDEDPTPAPDPVKDPT